MHLSTLFLLGLVSFVAGSPAPAGEREALSSIESFYDFAASAYTTASGWDRFEDAYENFEDNFYRTQTIVPSIAALARTAADEDDFESAISQLNPTTRLALATALIEGYGGFIAQQTYLAADIRTSLLSGGERLLHNTPTATIVSKSTETRVIVSGSITTTLTNVITETPETTSVVLDTTMTTTTSDNAAATNGVMGFGMAIAGIAALAAAL